MSDLTAPPSALTAPSPGTGWPRRKFIFLVTFALVLHVAMIVIFGTKQPVSPRPAGDLPHLQLANRGDEIIALSDPTLFARPNAWDFVTAFWQKTPSVKQPLFPWTEAPHFLLPAPGKLGATFRGFMQTNRPPDRPLNFKLEPQPTEPIITLDDGLPQKTTLQISGELAQRRRLNQVELPSISVNDVIGPSKVQVLVDPAGDVFSTVLLESSTLAAADQRALQLARSLRFAPAPQRMFGELLFTWHSVPMIATNAP